MAGKAAYIHWADGFKTTVKSEVSDIKAVSSSDSRVVLTIEMEYYLVDAKTGYVYDGFSHESKTANMINALIVQGGKNMPVNMLFQRVMEEQVKKVVKDMGSKGLDRLKAVSGT